MFMRNFHFIPVNVNALMNLQWSLHLSEVLIWLKKPTLQEKTKK